jgi:hypothetical protein
MIQITYATILSDIVSSMPVSRVEQDHDNDWDEDTDWDRRGKPADP